MGSQVHPFSSTKNRKKKKEKGKRKKTKKMMYFQSRSAIFSNKQT
jgi:hypothetical protein